MSSNPLSTLQLTSPLPSPSATPGRPVMGGDDQALHSQGASSSNSNEGNSSTITGESGGGIVVGGNNSNSNHHHHNIKDTNAHINRRDTICLQLPPVVSAATAAAAAAQTEADRLGPCHNIRRSLPPLVFNPPLTHGDALYPLANIPTPSMLRQLPFTMSGARGILEEMESSSADGQVAVHVSSDIDQACNQSPRKRPVSWFSKEEDWETNIRSSKRTETSVRAFGLSQQQHQQEEQDCMVVDKQQLQQQQRKWHSYNHLSHTLASSSSSSSNSTSSCSNGNSQVPGNNEQHELFAQSSASASTSSSMFPSSIQSPLLPNNTRAPTDTPSSPSASAAAATASYPTIDNPEESPNSALPSPSLSPVSSGAQDIIWSQADTSNSPEMIPLDKQQQQLSNQTAAVPSRSHEQPQQQSIMPSTINTATATTLTTSPSPTPTSASTTTLFSSPAHIFDTYAELPQNIQNYFLVHLLRRSPMSTLRLANSAILHALRMDIIAHLPPFLTHRILRLVDFSSLCRATAVSRQWHKIIDNDAELWQAKFKEAGYVVSPDDTEQFFGDMNLSSSNQALVYKELYRRHYRMQLNWKYNRSKRMQLTGHSNNVVTCLQFDDDKIITGSDDQTVNIYDIKTGKLRRVLEGHDGGVWALQYVGNTLVTGSTDRTIRVWDIDTGECREILRGHMSTVRCLTIVMPTRTRAGHLEPQHPMLVSGSRDTTLQVWMLPMLEKDHSNNNNDNNNDELHLQRRTRHSVMPLHAKTSYPLEPMTTDTDDPMAAAEWNNVGADYPGAKYHVHTLTGHTMSVRDLAAHGNILASGSYDNTVRLWHLEMGQLRHVLVGHEQKVYSVVLDPKRNRCISGSMDSTVRIWSIVDGSCLHVLGGHTILVGLLGLTDNFLVSAAADQTLRVWSPDEGERQHVLIGHQGAITSFQHDEHKIVSGSEGGLKMWNIKTGELMHDLIKNVSGVWRVAFDERRCVAAVKCADNITRLEVLDYGVHGLE